MGLGQRALEDLVSGTIDPQFWRGRRVFVTGHTGFKGAWLCLWLQRLGAHVKAFALPPATQPNLFDQAGAGTGIDSRLGDIRDVAALGAALQDARPSVVLHLAAQAIVAEGYRDPAGTFATNLSGTINLLEAMRACPGIDAAVLVTSDKCYAPAANGQPLQEDSPLGGNDPYSASKGCAEIAINCWRRSFFAGGPRIATVRAGNVIGGGDWSDHRLLPDLARAFAADRPAELRMPQAVRPWQHVLDALHGYLMLAERLTAADGECFADGWNFGPEAADEISVGAMAQRAATLWGPKARLQISGNFQQETGCLRLDSSRARSELGWRPHWPLVQGLELSIEWYRAWAAGADLRAFSLAQLDDFMAAT